MGVSFPPIPEQPGIEEARNALAALKRPFREMPFVTETDRAVAIADVLTAVVRRILPVAPMFAYSSPAPGTGKSLIVDIICIIATGERAAVITACRDEEEMRKRIDSAVLAGDAIVAIDNFDSPIRGSAICTALTQAQLKPRPLGRSELVQVANTALYHSTGNNLLVEGDATRRVLVSRLDARVERPELRSFTFNAIAEVREQRPALVVAALTVIRAFLLSGAGERTTAPLGGFEAWDALVRDALLWLGEPDPVDSMENVRKSDPHHSDLKALLTAWYAAFGDKEVLAREVIATATDGQHQGL
jgi:hypothetical protein